MNSTSAFQPANTVVLKIFEILFALLVHSLEKMSRIRNNDWQEDITLKEKLLEHLSAGLNHTEIVQYMKRDFCQYTAVRPNCKNKMDGKAHLNK